jgi:hypothetical protein
VEGEPRRHRADTGAQRGAGRSSRGNVHGNDHAVR